MCTISIFTTWSRYTMGRLMLWKGVHEANSDVAWKIVSSSTLRSCCKYYISVYSSIADSTTSNYHKYHGNPESAETLSNPEDFDNICTICRSKDTEINVDVKQLEAENNNQYLFFAESKVFFALSKLFQILSPALSRKLGTNNWSSNWIHWERHLQVWQVP